MLADAGTALSAPVWNLGRLISFLFRAAAIHRGVPQRAAAVLNGIRCAGHSLADAGRRALQVIADKLADYDDRN